MNNLNRARRRRGMLGQYAGFITRAVALILDILIVIAIAAVVYWSIWLPVNFFLGIDPGTCSRTVNFRFNFWGSLDNVICLAANGISSIAAILAAPVYFTFMYTSTGQTIGMYVMGVRVVRLDGKPMTVLRSLWRWLWLIISMVGLGIGFLWVLWDDRRQGWADKMAGTCVVYAWRAEQNDILVASIRRFFTGRTWLQPNKKLAATTSNGNYDLITIAFKDYERLDDILNKIQDGIAAKQFQIVNATVLVKGDNDSIGVLAASDLSVGNRVRQMADEPLTLPDYELRRILAEVPRESFVIAVVLNEKYGDALIRQISRMTAVMIRRFDLGDSSSPTSASKAPSVTHGPKPAVSAAALTPKALTTGPAPETAGQASAQPAGKPAEQRYTYVDLTPKPYPAQSTELYPADQDDSLEAIADSQPSLSSASPKLVQLPEPQEPELEQPEPEQPEPVVLHSRQAGIYESLADQHTPEFAFAASPEIAESVAADLLKPAEVAPAPAQESHGAAATPELVAPELAAPELAAPELAAPVLVVPETASPGYAQDYMLPDDGGAEPAAAPVPVAAAAVVPDKGAEAAPPAGMASVVGVYDALDAMLVGADAPPQPRNNGKAKVMADAVAIEIGADVRRIDQLQDLTAVKFVGAAYAQRLYRAGIGTFWELANCPDDELRAALQLTDAQHATFPYRGLRADARRLAEESASVGWIWNAVAPDDFEPLKGIGKVFELRLYQAGILTYAALAAATPEQLATACRAQPPLQPDYTSWIRQAQEIVGLVHPAP